MFKKQKEEFKEEIDKTKEQVSKAGNKLKFAGICAIAVGCLTTGYLLGTLTTLVVSTAIKNSQ